MGAARGRNRKGYKAGHGPRHGSNRRPSHKVWWSLEYVAKCPGKRIHPIPRVGDRMGELTVIGYTPGKGGICLAVSCSCGGAPYKITASNLRNGRSLRCQACRNRMLPLTNSRRYATDIIPDAALRKSILGRIGNIIRRCEVPEHPSYADYGGRGIRVWPRWIADRADFARYIASLPAFGTPGFELDRTDNDKGYEPGNLRWVSKSTNYNNRRTVSALTRRVHELEARLRHCKCGATPAVHSAD